jgi:hypothetical protein
MVAYYQPPNTPELKTSARTKSLAQESSWGQSQPSMKTRLLDEAENDALISCEQGAKSSQEAAGFHYYLRQARNDPKKKTWSKGFRIGDPCRREVGVAVAGVAEADVACVEQEASPRA